VPTALLLGGVAAGAVLALLARLVNGVGARRRARRAHRVLRERIAAVADELVLAPLERELAAHDGLREALERAGAGGRAVSVRTSVPLVTSP